MNIIGKFIERFLRLTFPVLSLLIYASINKGDIFDPLFPMLLIAPFFIGILGWYLQLKDIREAIKSSLIYIGSAMFYTGLFVIFIKIID